MDFKKQLISGTFIKRYKRFLVDVKIKDKVITSHCPNTGSMMGLLKAGNKVWLSLSDDPKRKLQYTLQLIQVNNALIGINTHLTNKIFFEALKKRKLIILENLISSNLNINLIKGQDLIFIWKIIKRKY